MAVRMVIVLLFECPEMMSQPTVGTGPQQNELAAIMDTIMNCMGDQRHAFLMIEPPDITNDRPEHVPQPKALAQSRFVLVLVVERSDPVLTSNIAIGFGVPKVVI